MDVDTLLTRQMELHTTTRRPPKSAEQLATLRNSLLAYKDFLGKLQTLTDRLQTDRVTLFQCFMHISVGGAVQFDKQAQCGTVPMHQAKVLTRTAAVDFEPVLRSALPEDELSAYVQLTTSLRTTLRVKVEDENDLMTVQKSVVESVEYLDFIFKCSKGDINSMFSFYMSEDGPSLLSMITNADPELAQTLAVKQLHSHEATVNSMLVHEWNPRDPIPSDECFIDELRAKVEILLSIKTHASEKVVVARTLVNWLTTLSGPSFKMLGISISETMVKPLSQLCCDKRSSLSRLACEAIALISHRMSDLECVPLCDDEVYWPIISQWVTALLNGVYVSVQAISQATDSTVRNIITDNHGRLCIVTSIIASLEGGKHNELRRKCLAYLSLCIVGADANSNPLSEECVSTLVTVAEKYVDVGDSATRRMARVLCIVLRTVSSTPVEISDSKIESLIEKDIDLVKESLISPSAFSLHLFKM